MTDGFEKLRKSARRRRWLSRPGTKRPTVGELVEARKRRKVPGFIRELKKKAKAVLNVALEKREFDWDKYESLLEQTYRSADIISRETGLPFNLVITARALDFLEPSNPMFPVETRTATDEKMKKYGMPTDISWANAGLILRDLSTAKWAEEMGWLEDFEGWREGKKVS